MKKYFIRHIGIPEHNKVTYVFNTGLTYLYLSGYNAWEGIRPDVTITFIERLLNYNHVEGLVYSPNGVVTFLEQVYDVYDSYPHFKEELYNLIERFGEKIDIGKEAIMRNDSFNIKVKLIK